MIHSILYGFQLLLFCQLAAYHLIVVLPRRKKRLEEFRRKREAPRVPDQELLEKLEAVNRHQLKTEFSNALPVLEAYAESESAIWLNACLSRVWCFLMNGDWVDRWMRKRLDREVEEFLASWVGSWLLLELRLIDFQWPAHPPYLRDLRAYRHPGDSMRNQFLIMNCQHKEAPIVLRVAGKFVLDIPFDFQVIITGFTVKLYYRLIAQQGQALSLVDYPQTLDYDVQGTWGVGNEPLPELWKQVIRQYLVPYQIRKKFLRPRMKTFMFDPKKKLEHLHATDAQPISPEEGASVVKSNESVPSLSRPGSTDLLIPPETPTANTLQDKPLKKTPSTGTLSVDAPERRSFFSRSRTSSESRSITDNADASGNPAKSTESPKRATQSIKSKLFSKVSSYKEQFSHLPQLRDRINSESIAAIGAAAGEAMEKAKHKVYEKMANHQGKKDSIASNSAVMSHFTPVTSEGTPVSAHQNVTDDERKDPNILVSSPETGKENDLTSVKSQSTDKLIDSWPSSVVSPGHLKETTLGSSPQLQDLETLSATRPVPPPPTQGLNISSDSPSRMSPETVELIGSTVDRVIQQAVDPLDGQDDEAFESDLLEFENELSRSFKLHESKLKNQLAGAGSGVKDDAAGSPSIGDLVDLGAQAETSGSPDQPAVLKPLVTQNLKSLSVEELMDEYQTPRKHQTPQVGDDENLSEPLEIVSPTQFDLLSPICGNMEEEIQEQEELKEDSAPPPLPSRQNIAGSTPTVNAAQIDKNESSNES